MKMILMIFILGAMTLGGAGDLKSRAHRPVVLQADQESTALSQADKASLDNSCSIGGIPNACCKYWDVTTETRTVYVLHVIPIKFTDTSCTTGGSVKCALCNEESEGE